MQEKNKLDNMAEKYKEEMMRLYKKKRTEQPSAPEMVNKASAVTERQAERKAAEPDKSAEQHGVVKENNAHTKTSDTMLMKPPMPKIPQDYGNGTEKAVQMSAPKSKFPTAEEIIVQEQRAVKPIETIAAIATITSDPRFESAENPPHNQGNYNYDAPEALEDLEDYVEDIIPDIDYPDNDTDFEDLFDDDDDNGNAPEMKGTGYLQVEVTTGDGAVPVSKAAVIVTQEIGGQSYLVTMKLTDRSGATDVIPLPAPSASFLETPDPAERPFSEYNVTVYKKGFYTVPEVTVPIFDTVKSIQPVALIPLAENELQGTQKPDGGAQNG